MKQLKTLYIAALMSAVCATSGATNPMIDDVLADNPTLKALRAQSEAEIAARSAENSLPGPEAEFEHLWGGGATKWSFGLTQGFDWPGLYKARSRAIQSSATAFGYLYDSRRLDIAVEANSLLVKYQYACMRRAVLVSVHDNLEQLQQQLKNGLDHGLITILDYKKAALEAAVVGRDIQVIQAEIDGIVAALDELAGRTLDWRSYVPAAVPRLDGTVDDYIAAALDADPNYKAALATLTTAQLDDRAARLSTLPSFAVGYRHEKEEGTHFNGFSVSVGLPTWGVKRSKVASAARITAADSDIEVARRAVVTRVAADWRRASKLQAEVESIVKETESMSNYLELLRAAYQGGELSVLDYLREQSYYREVIMSTFDLEERYAEAMASLNRYAL